MNELRNHGVREVAIDEASAGQRIDNFLARTLKGVPKSHLYRILRSGEVRINGRRASPDTRLADGDRVRLPPVRTGASIAPAATSASAARAGGKLAVLHEDDDLLVLDKPAGVAVHGGSGISHGVIEQLRAARPGARFLELVHRLDRETSGVLVVAKKRPALTALHAAWRAGEVDKRYQVLARGRWRDAKRVVRLPVHRFLTQGGERRVRVEDDGQHAQTTFRRLATWGAHDPPLALLEAELHTGRTHQIRVHLTHLGFPLAGDDKYGDFAWNRTLAKQGLKRMFLHAASLALTHPRTGASLRFDAPLPADLAAFVDALGRDGNAGGAGDERSPSPSATDARRGAVKGRPAKSKRG